MPKDGEWQEPWETPPLPLASSLLRRKGLLVHSALTPPHRTPLHAAAFADNVSGLRMLLQHQAEVNATDHTGRTALMTAAENGQTAAVGV